MTTHGGSGRAGPAQPEVESLRILGDIVTFGEHQRRLTMPRWLMLLGLVVAEALFARVMSQVPRLGLVHALAILGVGIWAVMRRDLRLCFLTLAYLPGSEIIWRQSRAPVPNFAAPYITIILALAAVFLVLRSVSKPGRTAALYAALLVPSIIITITVTGADARQPIAFALAGPVTLTALVLLFCQVKIEPWFYRRLLWVVVIGGVGPLAIALTAIGDVLSSQGSIEFGTGSNFITSGGFGPVQVSSVMGLTALAAILLVLTERELGARVLAVGLAATATVQSFLTFSRGGMFATGIALGALAISQTTNPEGRRRVIAVVVVAFAFGWFVLVPRVDDFTGGKFTERFGQTETGRTTLANNDIDIFRRNVFFGVGPGMSKFARLPYDQCQLRLDKCSDEGSSHTEFTRMLSEHGVAGVGAIAVLGTLALQAFRRSGPSRSICVTFLAWAVAQMFYANLRVVAVPFAFAFAFVRVEHHEPPEDPADGRRTALEAAVR